MSDYKTNLVTAAIDFGTTYSGFAYSYRHDQLKIYESSWTDGDGKLETNKAPTTVLFNKEGEFDSFGFEAERKYADLADDDVHHDWKYFKHFKMKLHGRTRLRRDMKIMDDQGKGMFAIDVFSAVIKFLKDQLFKKIQKSVPGIKETDIDWAGILADQFTLALEPEAAVIYCKQFEVLACKVDGSPSLKPFAPGSQFMVIDMGGGTIDITLSEVQSDGTLKELYPPSGGPWGGTLVDQEINDFFENVFGNHVWNKFKSEHKLDYIEWTTTLEAKKRQCKINSSNIVKISLPHALYKLCHEIKDIKLQNELSHDRFASEMTKIKVKDSEFAKMFERPKQLVLEHVNEILCLPELKNVASLMMVGGFSGSHIMHKAVEDKFPDKTVIIPEKAGTVVMKGAVLYGFNKEQIHSRKLPFSYGISTSVPFDSAIHHRCHKFLNGFGEERVDGVFYEFIKKGQTVVAGKSKIEHSFRTPRDGEARVEVYQTPADTLAEPCFVCQPEFEKIGELRLYPGPGRQLIDVTMTLGDTILKVKAMEHGTNNKVKAIFDFLF